MVITKKTKEKLNRCSRPMNKHGENFWKSRKVKALFVFQNFFGVSFLFEKKTAKEKKYPSCID